MVINLCCAQRGNSQIAADCKFGAKLVLHLEVVLLPADDLQLPPLPTGPVLDVSN